MALLMASNSTVIDKIIIPLLNYQTENTLKDVEKLVSKCYNISFQWNVDRSTCHVNFEFIVPTEVTRSSTRESLGGKIKLSKDESIVVSHYSRGIPNTPEVRQMLIKNFKQLGVDVNHCRLVKLVVEADSVPVVTTERYLVE